MALLRFLAASGNVPFAIALGIAVVFFLLQISGVLGMLGGGDDSDGGGEHDAGDAAHDHDLDGSHDGADGDHDADHDGADDVHDHGGAHGRGFAAASLAVLGFGRIPFSILWQTFAIVFAAAGFALNARYFDAGGPPLRALVWTFPLSWIIGCVGVAVLAQLLGPLFAPKEQEATSRRELVGQVGVVISSKVTAEFGEVRIRDKSGHDLRVICKLAKGVHDPLLEQASVVVVECENGELFVAPLDPPNDDENAPGDEERAAQRAQN